MQVGSEGSKMRWGSVLWRVAVIFAVATLLISIFNPFLNAVWMGLRIPEYFSTWPGEMWSYKQHYYYLDLSGPTTFPYVESSFGEYWFQNWSVGVASWTGYALMAMFLLQALTIASGVIAVSKSSRFLMFLPAASNALVVVLMSTMSWSMSGSYARTFLPGFWLTLLSTLMFIFAAVVHFYLVRTLARA